MKKQNRLAFASSPYLRQHAENPVDWYEWGDEALQKAKNENKPILVSIGYAACHWCHVMANESFSNEKIAGLMNEHFVCIKIDREERPDIDQIYMEAAHLISGRGGWPLNAFALPDGRPFFAATYFPPAQWVDVLTQLNNVYRNEYSRALSAAESITNGMSSNKIQMNQDKEEFTINDYHLYYQNHIQLIDFELGGYQGSPKFPLPVGLEFFLQYHYLTGDQKSLEAVNQTLHKIANGGINDQIGGGFARYSTDNKWFAPHFEKMLYDNAQLISLYSHAFQISKNQQFADIIRRTIDFAQKELLDKSNGYYASIDADSEHEEGKFYVWTKQEIDSVLGSEEAEIISELYQITEQGNWEHGKNILYVSKSLKELSDKYKLTESELITIIDGANNKLLEHRNKRVRPATDDKILSSWNGLMISGLIDAYKALSNEIYLDQALKTALFIKSKMIDNSGTLYRVYKDGKVSVEGFLEDYAFVAASFISLYEVTFDIVWLETARSLADYVRNHFADNETNLFYFTSDKAENLIIRTKEYSDNVMPCSNSIMAHVFFKLGILFEKNEYSSIAEKMLAQVKQEITQNGPYYANWANLLGKFLFPKIEIAVLGENSKSVKKEIQGEFLPTATFAGGNEENLPLLEYRLVKGKTLIYVCEDEACKMPVDSSEKALALIKK